MLDEEEKQKQHHAELKAQNARWAGAMNSTFKALSVDLEGLGVYGGRVTADADLVMLMGVIESKVGRKLFGYRHHHRHHHLTLLSFCISPCTFKASRPLHSPLHCPFLPIHFL